MNTQYEVVNQRTGEISKVEELTEKDGFIDVVTATSSGIVGLRFRRISETEVENAGDYFSLREVGTQVSLDDREVISDEGKPVKVGPEVVAEIEQGKVNPDQVVEDALNTGTQTQEQTQENQEQTIDNQEQSFQG